MPEGTAPQDTRRPLAPVESIESTTLVYGIVWPESGFDQSPTRAISGHMQREDVTNDITHDNGK